MDTQTPADDSVRQEFIDMYEDTLVDLMEKNGDAPLTEDAERTMRVNAMVDTALRGLTIEGVETYDTFSMKGFNNAMDAVNRLCRQNEKQQ